MRRAALAGSITVILASSTGLAGAAATKKPLSFASRADSACAAAGAKVVALPVPTPQTVVPDVRSTEAIVTKLVVALKAIKPPAKDAKAYAAFIASTKEQATLLKETLSAFNANQASKITKLGDDGEAVGMRSDREAKALGLPACAKDYNPSKMPATVTPTTPTTTVPSATTGQSKDSSTTAPIPGPTPNAMPVATGTASGGASGTSGSAGGSTVVTGNSSQSATQNSNNTQSGNQSVGGVFTG